jgi:hypothetical protein
MPFHLEDSSHKTENTKRLKWVAVATSLSALLIMFYIIPNAFGQLFVSNNVAPIIYCDEVIGVLLTSHNSYFIPVTLSYDGADLEIDILNKTTGALIHEASFLSEDLHDEEEGLHHVARIQTGTTKFLLSFTESSQYYSSGGKLPSLPYRNTQLSEPEKKPDEDRSDNTEYYLKGTAFGLDVDSKDQDDFTIPASSKQDSNQGISGAENTSLPRCNSSAI